MGPDEAARALEQAQRAAGRSAMAAGYQQASAHLFVWGAVWIIVNLLGVLKAPYGQYLFPALMLCGAAASLIAAGRGPAAGRQARLTRSAWIALAVLLFAIGATVLTPANSLIAAEALICLGIGAAYMMLAGAVGARLAVIGLIQMVGTIAVVLWGRENFFLLMALIGGGGLLLGGAWLRKA